MNNNDFDPLNLKYHPACEIFPTLSNEELQSLAEDIKANGLLEPIVVRYGRVEQAVSVFNRTCFTSS